MKASTMEEFSFNYKGDDIKCSGFWDADNCCSGVDIYLNGAWVGDKLGMTIPDDDDATDAFMTAIVIKLETLDLI